VAWPVISKQVGFLGAGGGKNAILQIYAKKTPGQARLFQKQRRFKALNRFKKLPHTRLLHTKLPHTKLLHTKLPHAKLAQKKAALRAAADN
jgi:hypothetical protein